MIFFNKRKRFNGDVAALLPAFGIDMKEAGIMKLLNVLDLAWADKYNPYETALLVAYSFASGLYEIDIRRAESFVTERLKPIQSDWLKKGIVRSGLIEKWPAALEKNAIEARNKMDNAQEDKAVRQLMKSLCLGIVGDISRVAVAEGFSKTPIKEIELLVFGMFIVTETYTLAQKGVEKARPQLNGFHLDMANYVTNEYFLKDDTKDTNDVLEFHKSFSGLITERYDEYRKCLMNDRGNKASIFRETFNSLISNIFVDSLNNESRSRLLIPLTLKIAEFYTGCLASFK